MLGIWIYILIKVWNDKNVFSDLCDKFGISLISFLMLGAITFSVIFGSLMIWPIETSRDNVSSDIYSMKNISGIEGQFCLGSGNIRSEEYYYMFQKYNDGGLHRIELRSSDCIIYQDDNTNPHVSWQIIHYRPSYWAYYGQLILNITIKNNTMYDIHIPTNSVVMKFNVD